MRVMVGDPVDLSDLRGSAPDATTLAIASDRLMDAITAMLAEIRQETPPETRMVYRRDEPGTDAPQEGDGT